MARLISDIIPTHPYHVTARCINREAFQIPMNVVWTIMENYLHFIVNAFSIEIFSFLLMPNHFHMLVRSPNANLSAAMNYFMGETSRRISNEAGRINQLYGDRYHPTLIESNIHFKNAYKYIYQNPIRAGLCTRVEDYQYSTLHGLLGKSRMVIPVCEDTILFGPRFDWETLDWLNQRATDEACDEIRMALRRQIFRLPINKKNGKKSLLDTNLI